MYNSIANKHTNIMTLLGKWQRIYTDTFPKNRELPEKWKSKSTTTVVRTVTIKKKSQREPACLPTLRNRDRRISEF